MTTFTVVVESDYIGMGDSRRPTPSHELNAYCTVIVRVSYGYGYTRGSGRVWVEIFGAGRVRVRVASSATGTGRVAEMVNPHTPTEHAEGKKASGLTARLINEAISIFINKETNVELQCLRIYCLWVTEPGDSKLLGIFHMISA